MERGSQLKMIAINKIYNHLSFALKQESFFLSGWFSAHSAAVLEMYLLCTPLPRKFLSDEVITACCNILEITDFPLLDVFNTIIHLACSLLCTEEHG